ncbi:MAG TPA: LUD domain-containing protein [Candidatus Brachybacterium merdigallinarum]|nr:LUD domain-containing protein [Candidatus Brachybacterium merdigallinarum]
MSGWTDQRPTRTPGLSAKEEILSRLRAALDVPRRDEVTTAEDVPRSYQRADAKAEVSTDPARVRTLLVDRLEDYTAIVHRTTESEAPAAIAAALAGATRLVIPPGLPSPWTRELTAEITVDDGRIGARELDGIEAVLTGCHTAIAQTGTLVLRGDELGGRRVISLIPDRHVVVVRSEQVVLGVPKALERMNTDPGAAWTMISGPSATSDIELNRVEGVHGPRRLDVVLIDPDPEPEPDPAPEPTPRRAPDPASGPTPTPAPTPKEPR